MKMKRVIACVLCAALFTAMLAGCGNQGNNERPDSDPSAGMNQEESVPGETTEAPVVGETAEATEAGGTSEATEPTEAQMPVIPDHVVVSTPYGYMQYRDQWAEFMKTEQQTEENVVSVFFSAVINELEYPLFTVTIGEAEGEPICQMTDSVGVKRNVYVHVEEIVSTSALTEDEQNRLYAMQEEINYIIENIK